MAEPAAIIVPVMERPRHAASFMASLREACTPEAAVYAVANENDQVAIAAWSEAGATVITGPVTRFGEKVNFALGKTSEPWLFLTGSDVRFHTGWLDFAQEAAGQVFHVVGVNGMDGDDHPRHMLVRRSYVDITGASWDGPGIVCHEGYGHYVEYELVAVAQIRTVFVSAPRARVEHLHPVSGKAKDDSVYRLAQSHRTNDMRLFEERLAAHDRSSHNPPELGD